MVRMPPAAIACVSRAAAAAAMLVLASCAGRPDAAGDARQGAALRDALPVAAAALAGGQPDAARRLYRSLAERFGGAPEPYLGLGYIAFHDDDFQAAERYFVQAAERAAAQSELGAAARLGAGRAALARGVTDGAREHFAHAADAASPATAAWAVNGLAVAAALDGDWETAAAHGIEAVRMSADHPRIAANLVRALAASGRTDEAAELYTARAESDWSDGDGIELARTIDAARTRDDARRSAARRLSRGLALHLPALAAPAPPPLRAGPPPPARGFALGFAGPPVAGAPRPRALLVGEPGPGADSDVPAPAGDAPVTGDAARRAAAAGVLVVPLGQSRRLHLDGEATAVLVAAPEVADVQLLTPDVLYVIGRSIGRTTVVVLADDERARERVVSVVLDLKPLTAALTADAGLAGVRARHLHRGVSLNGEVSSAEAADRAMRVAAAALPEGVVVENELRIAAPQQVNLEVQIAEVHRSVTEDLGINWEAFGSLDGAAFRFRVGRLWSTPVPVPGQSEIAIVDGTPAASFELSDRLDIGGLGQVRISAMIDALATAGLANVLARPNVTAVTGETASVFSGGEYPLPTGFEDGVIIFEYKKYGVLLDFVPTVLDNGRIVLTVRPEVSEPSLNRSVQLVGVDIPVINVRRAETTVEVGDGESIVIAGLFRNASNTVESGLPVLKDVPGVGALFGHTAVRSDELELIVVVTARLTGPSSARVDDGGGPLATRRAEGYHY